MDTTKEINNKRISIVGSSKKLVGKKLGKEIDSFDYVVRFNGAIDLLSDTNYTIDYGKRDDIHFFTSPYVKTMKPDLDCIENKPFFLFKKAFPQYKDIKCELIGKTFAEVEKEMKKGYSYSGVAVIAHLLKRAPKQVYLYGMDLYIEQPNYYDRDWSNYPEGYIPQEMKDLTDKLHSDGHLAHSRFWNAVVLKRLLIKYKDRVTYEKSLMKNIDYIISHRENFE